MRRPAAVMIAFSVMLLWSGHAAAEPIIQPGAAGLVVFADDASDGTAVAGGGAGTLLLGYNAEREPILIIPHAAGAFGYYGGDFSGIFARAMVGMKFGVSLSVEPSLVTRVGYGYYRLGVAGAEESVHGVAFQSGPALDYRVSREVSVGGQLLYDLFIDPDAGGTSHGILLGFTVGFGL
jgi:hypothetical protein